MSGALVLTRLVVAEFRNLENGVLEFGEGFNVLAGANGQGKTNLLEAVHVLCATKSFRTSKTQELVRHDTSEENASIQGVFVDEVGERKQAVNINDGRRMVRVDGKAIRSLAAYAVMSPVVVFHPAELELTMGAAAVRRRLLDRVTAYAKPASMSELDAYIKAGRGRQRVLEERGTSARDLDVWEELLANHGVAIARARSETLDMLAPFTERALEAIAGAGHAVKLSYAATAPADVIAYRDKLATTRERDMHRGSASVGPHRDDLAVVFDAREARTHASQGQHRALTLALKSAEMEFLASTLGKRPLLLLDDVSSELDPDRTHALFSFLREQRGQVLLTTTRAELIDTGATTDRRDFRVENGRVSRI